VTFTGHIEPAAAAFAAADIVAHTSILPEPFGRVIVEAMAAGRPVVAAAAGGALEIVREGETGRLVPPGDPAALAQALSELAADKAQRQRLGLAGRARAEQEYALPVMAERFMRVWAKAAAQ
jgi:glycosyltransferase involved in cell wall biosynthesis